jgi:hypothetical protein
MKRLHTLLPILLILCVAFCTSCKKILDLDLEAAEPQLVIEGNLTNIQGVQTVKISRTVPFDAANEFPAISGATVSLLNSKGELIYFAEASPGIYEAYELAGVAGETYTLKVAVNEQEYTASSTMPALVRLDSLTATEQTFGSEVRKIIAVNYQDPPTVKNYYLFKMVLNGKKVGQIFSESDFFTDGRYVTRDLFLSGYEDLEIETGDAVTVEMQSIDEPIYTYWRTLEQQYASGNPNDVTTPSNPPSNWTNRALGFFSAHTVQVEDVVVR